MTKAESITALENKITKNLRVALPGIIQKYDFKKQQADIKINLLEVFGEQTIKYPIITNVPVLVNRSGGATISLPIKKGDSCLIVFFDRDVTAWLKGGNDLKPKTARQHHITDAVAIMGLVPFSKLATVKNNDDVVIQYDGTEISIKPKGVVDIISAKELNIKTETITINCKTANVNVSETTALISKVVNVQCDDATLKVKNTTLLETKDATVKCTNSKIECSIASLKATSSINTETPTMTQKGNFKVDGNIEITGTSEIVGKLTTKNGITNTGANLVSNNITFETHKHMYQDVTTVVSPEGPCTVTKLPKASEVAQ